MTVPRLHVVAALAEGAEIRLGGDRAHYLRHVLRLREAASVHLFNGSDGEWRAGIAAVGRHEVTLTVGDRIRPQAVEPGPTLAFAPIRRNRLDWLIEKAVELGVAHLVPVITERTVVRPEGSARLKAIAIEAAEQCERLTVPPIDAPQPLAAWLAARKTGEPLLFADERGEGEPLARVLRNRDAGAFFMVGPEGGFTPAERRLLLAAEGAVPVTLGPRILRAETAALYLLACCQALRPEPAAPG
jgi:16S rRNA (uracil1498-N3)-methyltransferase